MTKTPAPAATAADSPFAMFSTDETLETQGVKIDYGKFYFTVGRMDRPGTPFANYMRDEMRPYTRAIQLGQMDERVAEAVLLTGFARHIVLGWGSTAYGEGKMVGKDGEALDFTEENVFAVLKGAPELFKDLLGQTRDFTTFRRVAAGIDSKN